VVIVQQADHPQYDGLDVTDPIVNAKAALEVSGGGENTTQVDDYPQQVGFCLQVS
jgi:hypothetical protein